MPAAPIEKRLAKVIYKEDHVRSPHVDTPCWIWKGYKAKGYGMIRYQCKSYQAHRLVYELEVGPIPEDLHLDHLCVVTDCVNPEHMEPVTQSVNMARILDRRGTCVNGHPINEENTYTRMSGKRGCRVCNRDYQRKKYKASRGRQELGRKPVTKLRRK